MKNLRTKDKLHAFQWGDVTRKLDRRVIVERQVHCNILRAFVFALSLQSGLQLFIRLVGTYCSCLKGSHSRCLLDISLTYISLGTNSVVSARLSVHSLSSAPQCTT